MNPVLILTKNNRPMNQRCFDHAVIQDTPATVYIHDNCSTDDTREWMKQANDPYLVDISTGIDLGVSEGWNFGLNRLFDELRAEHVLVINSDTVIPKWFYSTLLSYPGDFVSGVSVGSMEEIASPPPRKELVPSPDFSAFLIRKECWYKVGQFDSSMVLYASDLDYHIRAHRAGIRLMNAGVPFFHERSSTLNNASPAEKAGIKFQADADRAELRRKWGCNAWDGSYAAMFDESSFGVEPWRDRMVKNMLGENHL